MPLRNLLPGVGDEPSKRVQHHLALVDLAQKTSPLKDADRDEVATRPTVVEIDEAKPLSSRPRALLFDDTHFIMVA